MVYYKLQEEIWYWRKGFGIWFLIDYKWANSKWHYRTLEDMPGNIHITDSTGN